MLSKCTLDTQTSAETTFIEPQNCAVVHKVMLYHTQTFKYIMNVNYIVISKYDSLTM